MPRHDGRTKSGSPFGIGKELRPKPAPGIEQSIQPSHLFMTTNMLAGDVNHSFTS